MGYSVPPCFLPAIAHVERVSNTESYELILGVATFTPSPASFLAHHWYTGSPLNATSDVEDIRYILVILFIQSLCKQ